MNYVRYGTRKFGNVERNSHCDVLHITPVRVARLFLDCNGVFAIKAYEHQRNVTSLKRFKTPYDHYSDAISIAIIGPQLSSSRSSLLISLHHRDVIASAPEAIFHVGLTAVVA